MVSWRHDIDFEYGYGEYTCGKHSGDQCREFFEALAERIVEEFDVNPCLDTRDVVMALTRAPDPPLGFCENIGSDEAMEDFSIYCPLRPMTIVSTLDGLASTLEPTCERYLKEAFDGEFPI